MSLVGEPCSLCYGSGKVDLRDINQSASKSGFFDQIAFFVTILVSVFACWELSETQLYSTISSLTAKALLMMGGFFTSYFTIGILTTLPVAKRFMGWIFFLLALAYALSTL